jgi:pimeloyl-ACP methyl ester carboxylesterase
VLTFSASSASRPAVSVPGPAVEATRRALPTSLPLYVVEVEPRGVPSRAPDAPVFVMLHGYGGNRFTWRHWAPSLALRGRVLLVDMKGFGRAPKPDDGAYGPADLAALVVALLREMDLRRVTLVGHSLGGGVALLATLQSTGADRSRLERLVLVASAAYPQRLPPFVSFARRPRLTAALLRLIGGRRTIRLALRSIVFDARSVTEGMVAAYGDPLGTRDGLRAALDAGRVILPDDIDELSARFPEIDLPTLVLWGDHDRVVPISVGRRLAVALPRARLIVLERCGHMVPEERPRASLAAVEEFLDETTNESAAGG